MSKIFGKKGKKACAPKGRNKAGKWSSKGGATGKFTGKGEKSDIDGGSKDDDDSTIWSGPKHKK